MVIRKFIRILAIIIPFLFTSELYAQKEVYINLSDIFPLNDFKLSNEGSLKVQSLLKNGQIDESIEGKYKFVINGYIEKLDFKNGEASLPTNISESSVLYIKHEKSTETVQHLYYQIAGFVFEIPFYILWLLPLLIIIIALVIKRIIMLFLIIAVIVFFVAQGLGLSDYFELIKESILKLF
jgi:hypothetical protein